MRDAPPAHCTTPHRTALRTPHSESLVRHHPLRAGRGESAASQPAPGPLHLARARPPPPPPPPPRAALARSKRRRRKINTARATAGHSPPSALTNLSPPIPVRAHADHKAVKRGNGCVRPRIPVGRAIQPARSKPAAFALAPGLGSPDRSDPHRPEPVPNATTHRASSIAMQQQQDAAAAGCSSSRMQQQDAAAAQCSSSTI